MNKYIFSYGKTRWKSSMVENTDPVIERKALFPLRDNELISECGSERGTDG